MLNGKVVFRDGWGRINLQHSLGQYYRSLFYLTYGIKLQRPSNNEHITVIRPEDNVNFACDTIFSFEILPQLWWNGNAIWLPVVSCELDEYRKGMGLEDYELHFCIGYLTSKKIKGIMKT